MIPSLKESRLDGPAAISIPLTANDVSPFWHGSGAVRYLRVGCSSSMGSRSTTASTTRSVHHFTRECGLLDYAQFYAAPHRTRQAAKLQF